MHCPAGMSMRDYQNAGPGRKASIFARQASASSPSANNPPLPAPHHSPSGSIALAAIVLGVLALGLLLVVMQMSSLAGPAWAMIGPMIGIKPAFTEITQQQTGTVLYVEMKTDAGHPNALCNQLMETIYTEAGKNDSAQKLHLVLQVEGKEEVKVQVDDLDAVRQYGTPKLYEASGHRQFVGARLVDAGLMSKAAIASTAPSDDQGVIGNFYESNSNVSPRLGIKFLDESRVQLYRDDTPYAICNYSQSGDSITIPTSCNTLHIQRKPGGLQEDLFGWFYLDNK